MRRYISYLAVIALLIGAMQAASATPSRPQVVVMGAPLVPYVRAILGNTGVAQSLMQPAQDMHDFALAPSQAEALETADMLVIPDIGISPVFARLVKAHPKLKVVELSLLNGADALPYRTDNPWLDGKKKSQEQARPKEKNPRFPKRLEGFQEIPTEPPAPTDTETLVDPHLWLDPERMAAMAGPLANELSAFSPGNRAVYQANAQEMARHLRRDVTPSLRAMLSARRPTEKEVLPFITAHPAFQYFITRFGLPYSGQISVRPDEYLGAATLDRLYDAAKNTRIRCVMAESRTSFVERIAQSSGARIMLVRPEQAPDPKDAPPADWIQNDYDRFLYGIARAFKDCL